MPSVIRNTRPNWLSEVKVVPLFTTKTQHFISGLRASICERTCIQRTTPAKLAQVSSYRVYRCAYCLSGCGLSQQGDSTT